MKQKLYSECEIFEVIKVPEPKELKKRLKELKEKELIEK